MSDDVYTPCTGQCPLFDVQHDELRVMSLSDKVLGAWLGWIEMCFDGCV